MSEENVNEDQTNQENKQENVDFKTYEQTKNDMHKFKRQYIEMQEKFSQLEEKLNEAEKEKLQSSNNYKALYEKAEQKAKEASERLTDFEKRVIEDKKMNAIKQAALKDGLNPEFIDLLDAFDTSDVIVEQTDRGSFNVIGSDNWVETLKKDRPSFFKVKADAVFDNSHGNDKNREKTYSKREVLALQKENPELYKEIITKKRHLIKN